MGMDNSTMPGMVFTVTTTTISTWVWTIQRCLGWCSRSLLLRSLHGYGQFNDAWDGVHGHYYYDLYMGMDNSTMPGMVFTVTTTTISTWVWTIQRCLGWCSRSLLLRSLHGF